MELKVSNKNLYFWLVLSALFALVFMLWWLTPWEFALITTSLCTIITGVIGYNAEEAKEKK